MFWCEVTVKLELLFSPRAGGEAPTFPSAAGNLRDSGSLSANKKNNKKRKKQVPFLPARGGGDIILFLNPQITKPTKN